MVGAIVGESTLSFFGYGPQPGGGTSLGLLVADAKGAVTSVQAIYVPADDLTDPAPATAFARVPLSTMTQMVVALPRSGTRTSAAVDGPRRCRPRRPGHPSPPARPIRRPERFQPPPLPAAQTGSSFA